MRQSLYPAELLEDSLEAHLARPRAGEKIYLVLLATVIAAAVSLPLIQVSVTVRSAGIIRPVTEKQAIQALVAGIATQVFVKDNQVVEQGTPILQLRAAAFDDRAALLAAQAAAKQLLATDLALLLSTTGNGGGVREPLLRTEDYRREYGQLTTELEDNQLARQRAERELERTRALYQGRNTTATDLEEKEFRFAQLDTQSRLILERYRGRWQAALTDLRFELQELASQRAQLDETRAPYTITAPASGTVEFVASLSPGSYVSAGDLLALLSPRSELVAQVYVAPRDVGLLRRGMPARFMVDAFNYTDWGFIDGSVTDISDDFVLVDGRPMFKVTCALARTHLALRNGFTSELRKGMTLQARFVVAERSVLQLLRDDVADWLSPTRAPVAAAPAP